MRRIGTPRGSTAYGALRQARRMRARRFSALEVIIALALLAILFAALMPMLNNCSGDAKTGTWRIYETRLKTRPEMLAYYDFADRGSVTYNRAMPAETVEDYDANAYIGILRNGAQWATGRWPGRGAALFDGVDDFIAIGSFDVVNPADQPAGLTMIVSFRALDFGDGDAVLLSKAGGELGEIWTLGITSDGTSRRLVFTLQTTAGTRTLTAHAGDVATDYWLHAACVYDGHQMRLFLDGAQVGATPQTGSILRDPTAGVWIGDQPPVGGTAPFAGLIDEVAIFHSALRVPEIQEHYRMGHPQ